MWTLTDNRTASRISALHAGKPFSRRDVFMLLGSPAERSTDDEVWVYLPERPAVLIPSRALRLVFEDNVLVKHGYRAIALGETL